MGYLPRFIPPNSMVEITLRTFRGMHLLVGSPQLEKDLLSVIARGAERYGVRMHAFTFMSNHVHEQMSVRDAKQAEDFLRYTNRLIGDVVRKHTGWDGPVIHGRPSIDVILDDQKAVERLVYITSNGVKEGLVAQPADWPGASSARALLEQRDIVTTWSSSADRRAARRHRQPASSPAYQQTTRLRLEPLPCLARLSRDARRAWFRALHEQIANMARITRQGRPVLGAAAVRRACWHAPHPLDRTPPPIVHASSLAARERFLEEREVWHDAYFDASCRLAEGELDVIFPPGALLPRRPFVPWSGGPAG